VGVRHQIRMEWGGASANIDNASNESTEKAGTKREDEKRM